MQKVHEISWCSDFTNYCRCYIMTVLQPNTHQAVRCHTLDNSVQHLQQGAAGGALDVSRAAAKCNIEHTAYCLHEAVTMDDEVLCSCDGEQCSDDS